MSPEQSVWLARDFKLKHTAVQVSLLTFIERLAQLCSHTAIQRGVCLQGDGDKQGGVRRFGCRVIRWNIPDASHWSSLLLFISGHNSRWHMTPASTGAGSPGANVALEPRKQQRTANRWHDWESFIPGWWLLQRTTNGTNSAIASAPCYSPAGSFKTTHYKPQQRTVNTLPANTTWERTGRDVAAHKHACVKLCVKLLVVITKR